MRSEEQRALSEPIATPLTHDEEDDHRKTTEDIKRVFLRAGHHGSFYEAAPSTSSTLSLGAGTPATTIYDFKAVRGSLLEGHS